MAERIVSPGVFTRENDLSFIAQGIGEIGGAFIGPFKEGPAFLPTLVRSATEFQTLFGVPDGTYYTETAVAKYLENANSATIVRVAGIGGYYQTAPLAIMASGSIGKKIVATLHSTKVGDEKVGFSSAVLTSDGRAAYSGSFAITAPSLSGSFSASVLPSSQNDIRDVFGESPFGNKTAYSYTYFENIAAEYDTDGGGDEGVKIYAIQLPTQDFTVDAKVASTPWVLSQKDNNNLRYELFRFHTIGHGNVYNKKFKIGISNVKAAGENASTDYATFNVTLRKFDDTDKNSSIIESWGDVNLDPASPRYIARVIGDREYTIGNDGKITENGYYSNKSLNIRVEVSTPGSFPISAAPFGHSAYENPIVTTNVSEATWVPAVVFQSGSISNTTTSARYYSGFDFESTTKYIDNYQYLKPIPEGALTGSNVIFAFDSQLSYQMTGSVAADMVKRQFILGFQGGFDGLNPTVPVALAGDADWGAANNQGLKCNGLTQSGSVGYQKAINALSNPDEYDINLVSTPGLNYENHPDLVQKVIDMCEDRQDCFYIADFTDYQSSITTATEKANSVDSNYVGTYYPWLINRVGNKSIITPPSVIMPAVYASNDRFAAEWFAPAGLNRGGLTAFGAESLKNILTHAERDILYENKVNPIAKFPNQGIVAFGQKTLQDKASALDRINVRRLLINIKKFVASTSRYLVFEQNTTDTRARFINTVTPYLESIQQRQGLYAFNVVMDDSNNTPDVIDRNILAGAIFLQPARTAEFIVIDFNILPTGASFGA